MRNLKRINELLQGADSLKKEITEKRALIKKAVTKAQGMCKHPIEHVLEGECKPNDYVRTFPPFRVCTICGLAEEGWGCGWDRLPQTYATGAVKTVPRDEAMKYARTFLTQEEMDKLKDTRRLKRSA